MKRLLMVVLGASGLLASCNVTVTAPNVTPGTGASGTLRLTQLNAFETSYKLTQDVTDQNGQFIAAGTSVICDDADTTMYADVSWSGYLSKLYVQFKGLNTGQYQNVDPFTVGRADGRGTATYTFTPGMAPLSVKPQAIIVNGRVNRLGNTYVRLQGLDQAGQYSNILESTTAVPVLDCNS
ncbi:hypothetical protein [Deinococcus hohokamensis]|uniref:Lipoprotein n=1 Tax=Deinococcus hohokamensis TaxID=309883 RepID=A0ABV9IBK0_9DEIO